MPEQFSPTLRRRRLSARLRKIREDRKLHAVQVDRSLGWTVGKIARMERNEWKRPSPRDIEDLCTLYEVDDETRAYLVDLAKQSRQAGWWRPYADVIPNAYSEYIGLEAEAQEAETFELAVVPGLFQTVDYATALNVAGPYGLTEERARSQAELRATRAEVLTRQHDPLKLWAIIDEAALRRPVGGERVHREQLRHLLEITNLPNVVFQVIPQSVGAHPGTLSSFTVLAFPSAEDDPCAYVEILGSELFVEAAAQVEVYRRTHRLLAANALRPAQSRALLAEAAG